MLGDTEGLQAAHAFAVEQLNKQVCEVSVRELFGSDVAHHGVYLGRRPLVFLGKCVLDILCLCVGDNLGDALGLCKLLGQLHHQAGYGDAARGPQEL